MCKVYARIKRKSTFWIKTAYQRQAILGEKDTIYAYQE
jgi:hypothetical protein